MDMPGPMVCENQTVCIGSIQFMLFKKEDIHILFLFMMREDTSSVQDKFTNFFVRANPHGRPPVSCSLIDVEEGVLIMIKSLEIGLL